MFEKMKRDPDIKEDLVAETIGGISTLVWLSMKSLDTFSVVPTLAPSPNRNPGSMAQLRDMLKIQYPEFYGESITVVVGIVYPNFDGCTWHLDNKSNDWRPGYTKTGVFNTYIDGRDENGQVVIFHLQLIVSFRRKVGERFQPYATAVQGCVSNILHYTKMVQDDYNQLFGTIANKIPTVFDRENFFLDDKLHFERRVIHKFGSQEIVVLVVRPKIGPCRVFSYSMYIEPIFLLRDVLKTDQLLELCFAASLTNTPYWYHHVMMNLVRRHLDTSDAWLFSDHPFLDWLRTTVETFQHSEDDIAGKPTW